MTGQGKLIRSCVGLAVALVIVGTEGITAQRAPGGPAPSEFDAFYSLSPDSPPREGVPKGEVRGPFKLPSKAYPGAEHSYWVYVPGQYDASRPNQSIRSRGRPNRAVGSENFARTEAKDHSSTLFSLPLQVDAGFETFGGNAPPFEGHRIEFSVLGIC